MNCEEYKQAISADPSFDGGASHVAECSACQAFRNEILAMDATIGKALAIDVPKLEMPELPDIRLTFVRMGGGAGRGQERKQISEAESPCGGCPIGSSRKGSSHRARFAA